MFYLLTILVPTYKIHVYTVLIIDYAKCVLIIDYLFLLTVCMTHAVLTCDVHVQIIGVDPYLGWT